MKLSNLARNLRGAWMITPEQAAIMAPVLKGVLQGTIKEFEKASTDPYMVKCADFMPAPIGKANPYADKSIYVTSLAGTMMKYDNCGDPGTRTIGNGLLEADRNPEVIGHIIVADSGGGNADSVQEIARAVNACTKPVVAFVDGIAASACLYAISYCKQIIAHDDMDSVGSIGTLIQLSGYKKFVEADGYVIARVYADEATEKNAGYEAALEGNFKVIKEQRLNPLNDRFISDIKANRPNIGDEHTTGRIFYAKDVVGTLIDSIGSFESAVQAVMDLAAEQLEGETQTNTNTNSNMKNLYPTLLALALMQEQVFEADGSTVLQPDQLEQIEAALAAAANASSLQASVDELTRQLNEARETISARDARITELQGSLDAAMERLENPAPAGVQVDHHPEAGEAIKPAESFDDALTVCQEFLKG